MLWRYHSGYLQLWQQNVTVRSTSFPCGQIPNDKLCSCKIMGWSQISVKAFSAMKNKLTCQPKSALLKNLTLHSIALFLKYTTWILALHYMPSFSGKKSKWSNKNWRRSNVRKQPKNFLNSRTSRRNCEIWALLQGGTICLFSYVKISEWSNNNWRRHSNSKKIWNPGTFKFLLCNMVAPNE